MAQKKELPFVRRFQVSDPTQHAKGYTVYKVTSQIYSSSSPELCSEVVVWKRYTELKKLYKYLRTVHANLHLQGLFPAFPKATVFGRFDKVVIDERCRSAVELLKFASFHPPLYNSAEFSNFFKDAVRVNNAVEDTKCLPPPGLKPIIAYEAPPAKSGTCSEHLGTEGIQQYGRVAEIPGLDRREDSPTESCDSVTDSGDHGPSVQLAQRDTKNTEDVDGFEAYVNDAAVRVARACEAEAVGDIKSAFEFYKSAIGILLAGVQVDPDVGRRDNARRDIARFLRRAEDISAERSPPVTGRISIFAQLDLRMPIDGLVHYRVLGVLGKVQLVFDANADTVHVLKVLAKSSAHQRALSRANIVPTNVPHMVKLHRFHVTDNSIFLVLQHAKGGRLWDYVSSLTQSGGINCAAAMETAAQSSDEDNVYSGRKLIEPKADSYYECHKGLARNRSESYMDLYDPRTPVTENKIWEGPGDLEPDLLIANSQKLMEAVDETLRRSSEVCRRLGEQISMEHPRRCSRSNSNGPLSPSREPRASLPRSSSADNLDPRRKRVTKVLEVSRTADTGVKMPESLVRMWATRIITAVDSLHGLGIICRDLNPNNILLGDCGHVLLSYFSEWDCTPKTECREVREQLYTAPEVHGIFPVTEACDWWSVGALLFELLTGKSLQLCHPGGIWSHTALNIPGPLSAEAESLLQDLLVYDPRERLGCGVQGAEAIKAHPFFDNVDWEKL